MDDQEQLDFASRIGELLFKFINDKIGDDERTELYNWVYDSQENQELFEHVVYSEEFEESKRWVTEIDTEAALRDIQERIELSRGQVVHLQAKKRRPSLRIAACVALLVAILGGLYLGRHEKSNNTESTEVAAVDKNDVTPGGDRAVLTLADGKAIILDNAPNGTLTHDGNTEVVKSTNGRLIYRESTHASGSIYYNVLTTPRGGQYQVELPDGSKVWLNSSSSLRYPTAFTGNTRDVELTGEGYFEVARDPAKPFMVKTNTTNVNVLGTVFNVMAYSEEDAIKTTLLTGAVKIRQGTVEEVLAPGDQAQVAIDGGIKVIKNVNVEDAIAWKNGYFTFDKVDIKTVMRQLARWYDVQIEFEGSIPSQHFGGKIQRNLRLSQVLEILETNNVHFRIKGKKLTVMP